MCHHTVYWILLDNFGRVVVLFVFISILYLGFLQSHRYSQAYPSPVRVVVVNARSVPIKITVPVLSETQFDAAMKARLIHSETREIPEENFTSQNTGSYSTDSISRVTAEFAGTTISADTHLNVAISISALAFPCELVL